MVMRPRSHRPPRISAGSCALPSTRGKGFGGAKVEGRLGGIASSVRLSDRIATGVGVLDLDFRASATGVAGVYQAVAGILGTVTLDGSDRSNVCTLSFETAGGRAFQLRGEPDREPA